MRPLLTVAYLSHHSPSFNKMTIVSNSDQICLKKRKSTHFAVLKRVSPPGSQVWGLNKEDVKWEMWAHLVLWHFNLGLIVFGLMDCFPVAWTLVEKKQKTASQIASVSPSLWKTAARTALVPLCRAAEWSGMASQAKKTKNIARLLLWGRHTHTLENSRLASVAI